MFINSIPNITVTKVFSTNRFITSSIGVTTRRENRNQWGLLLKLTGKTYYTVNGKEILSDRLHPVLLPKGCTYSWKCVESGECIAIEFDANESYQEIFSFEIPDNNHFSDHFFKIESCLNFNTSTSILESTYLLYGLLLLLGKSKEKEYVPKKKSQLIEPAVNYMIENYQICDLNNNFLAELCGISTVYFRKTFEKSYGVSPIKFLHNLRMKKAKAILRSDYESIGQVAESVGYSNIYHFSKMFKQYTGMSPSEYAKK